MIAVQLSTFISKKNRTLVSISYIFNRIYKRCMSESNIDIKMIDQGFKHGSEVTVKRFISFDDVKLFSTLSGDNNPIHTDSSSGPAVVHGAFLNGLVSGVIGTRLPGPGSVVVSQKLRFPNHCYVEDTVKINVKINSVRKLILCTFTCMSESQNCIVLEGEAKLLFKK